MSEKITADHLSRLAVIYVRQSTPGQVRNHPESRLVQRKLYQRARDLGWRENAILTFEADLGESAKLAGTRSDFETVLQRVKDKQVGIVLGGDVSRLSRNSLDWTLLTYWCAVPGVVMGDHTQVLDPALPQDSLVLGIQGVLAVHELHTIRQRMERGLDEKASRGELHHGIPRGYVVVERRYLRKHPDRRVQRTIERVFNQFQSCASVGELLAWLWSEKLKRPSPADDGEGLHVTWVDATYPSVLDLLQHRTYAGVYVHPRDKTETQVRPDGQVKKTVRRARTEEWKVFRPDNHPAYISVDQYEANQEKIAMNAPRLASQSGGAPQRGEALLSGLIVCRRCEHKMQVRYGGGGVRYACRRGHRQRAAGAPACLSFGAQELERQLSEQILYAVSPAGVTAAQVAAQRLDAERQARRQMLEDELKQVRYEADLGRRRLDRVDPANPLVFDTLAQELETALVAVQEHEDQLQAFDQHEPPRPTPEQRAELEHLGTHLEQVWFDPQTDGRLRKQIVRTLIEHVYADVDEERDEVVLWVQWAGGHHTELRAPRRGRSGRAKAEDLSSIIATLRKVAHDEAISRMLNRSGRTTERAQTWTPRRVGQYRKRHGLAPFNRDEKHQHGWLLQQEAATHLGISPMSVHRLVARGILPAERHPGLPSVVNRSDLRTPAVKRAVARIQSHGHGRLPDDPNQLDLFPGLDS